MRHICEDVFTFGNWPQPPPSRIAVEGARILVLIPSVILCVDDEPTALMVRRLVLSIAGYDVLTAADGDAALTSLCRSHVDLVITDHFLPDRTGAQVAEEMKRLKPEVPIVLLTGAPEPPPGSENADLVLTKGLDPTEFLAAIANLITKRQSSEIEMS
jgi:CheY-like chemotaxis protein